MIMELNYKAEPVIGRCNLIICIVHMKIVAFKFVIFELNNMFFG